MRSLPSWTIIQEGNSDTLRAVVYLNGRHNPIRVQGNDRQIAALAAFLKHNGIGRSFNAWQKILMQDPLFTPEGGGFAVPSLASIKMYLHREFPKYLQRAFDESHSGFSAARVIEQTEPGSHGTQYRIRGTWEVFRR
jgi:hypothetical protein